MVSATAPRRSPERSRAEGQHQRGVDEQPHHDRRHACHDVDEEADGPRQPRDRPSGPYSTRYTAAMTPERHGDEGRQPDLLQRPDERVVDAAPALGGETLRIEVVRKPALSARSPCSPPCTAPTRAGRARPRTSRRPRKWRAGRRRAGVPSTRKLHMRPQPRGTSRIATISVPATPATGVVRFSSSARAAAATPRRAGRLQRGSRPPVSARRAAAADSARAWPSRWYAPLPAHPFAS